MSAENDDVKNKQFENETENVNASEDVAQNVESGDDGASEGVAKEASDEGRDKLEKDFAKLKDDYIRLYAEMDNMKKRAHLESEKDRPYMSAPSGIPSVQQSLPVLLTVASQEDIPLSRIAAVFSEKAAEMFGIRNRGFIKEGYYADIVIADPEAVYTVRKDDLKYKCGWCPYEGVQMKGKIDTVFVNGYKSVREDGTIQNPPSGKKLFFK